MCAAENNVYSAAFGWNVLYLLGPSSLMSFKASHLNLETDTLRKKERKLNSIKSKIKKEKL